MTHLGNFASGGSKPRVPHLLSARSVLDSERAAAELKIYITKGTITQLIWREAFSFTSREAGDVSFIPYRNISVYLWLLMKREKKKRRNHRVKKRQSLMLW